MGIDEINTAVAEAESTLRAVDRVSTRLARLLTGRLRHVDNEYYLKAMKRELRDFNIHTGKWKA